MDNRRVQTTTSCVRMSGPYHPNGENGSNTDQACQAATRKKKRVAKRKKLAKEAVTCLKQQQVCASLDGAKSTQRGKSSKDSTNLAEVSTSAFPPSLDLLRASLVQRSEASEVPQATPAQLKRANRALAYRGLTRSQKQYAKRTPPVIRPASPPPGGFYAPPVLSPPSPSVHTSSPASYSMGTTLFPADPPSSPNTEDPWSLYLRALRKDADANRIPVLPMAEASKQLVPHYTDFSTGAQTKESINSRGYFASALNIFSCDSTHAGANLFDRRGTSETVATETPTQTGDNLLLRNIGQADFQACSSGAPAPVTGSPHQVGRYHVVFDTSSLLVADASVLHLAMEKWVVCIPYTVLDEVDKLYKGKYQVGLNKKEDSTGKHPRINIEQQVRMIRNWFSSSAKNDYLRLQSRREVDLSYHKNAKSNDDYILGFAVYLKGVITDRVIFVTEDQVLRVKAIAELGEAFTYSNVKRELGVLH